MNSMPTNEPSMTIFFLIFNEIVFFCLLLDQTEHDGLILFFKLSRCGLMLGHGDLVTIDLLWIGWSKFKEIFGLIFFDFHLHPVLFCPFLFFRFYFLFGWTGLSPENINILDSWTRFWVQFIFRQWSKF